MNNLPLESDKIQIKNLELVNVEISLRDSIIGWEIIRDRFNDEIHSEFSTSTNVFFFDECEADDFVKIMQTDGLEAELID